MPEQPSLSCPQCHEKVLPDDKFCIHCGRRLPSRTPAASPKRRFFPQWPLAAVGLVVLLAAGWEVHHQSVVIHRLRSTAPGSTQPANATGSSAASSSSPSTQPSVSTSTTYPSNLPASWAAEVKAYQHVQLELRVPKVMSQPLTSTTTRWSWGEPHTPYRVVMSIVGKKAAPAHVQLGPKTWGTSISHQSQSISQSLFINWAPHKWVEVAMTVPASHAHWLEMIAKSVQVL